MRLARPWSVRWSPPPARLEWICALSARMTVTLWLISCGIGITFTAARQPFCLRGSDRATRADVAAWQVGTTCVLQRVGILAGVLALIASTTLFISLSTTHSPFTTHLLGTLDFEDLPTPPTQPYPFHFTPQSHSFSVSSSKSLISQSSAYSALSSGLFCIGQTTTTSTDNNNNNNNSNNNNNKGLGISLLTPRPSIASLRPSYLPPPPSAPLPPLPIYNPTRLACHSAADSAYRAIHPPSYTFASPRRASAADSAHRAVYPPSHTFTSARRASAADSASRAIHSPFAPPRRASADEAPIPSPSLCHAARRSASDPPPGTQTSPWRTRGLGGSERSWSEREGSWSEGAKREGVRRGSPLRGMRRVGEPDVLVLGEGAGVGEEEAKKKVSARRTLADEYRALIAPDAGVSGEVCCGDGVVRDSRWRGSFFQGERLVVEKLRSCG
ncbi:hypothetical protein LTR50_001325 [Elasticomyces elasticus]|nr:hypothetical protein LTR50_001325 [Elasticomyces elasticus]